MPNIKIIQLLCPRRHCIAGLAFNPEQYTEEQTKKMLTGGLQATKIDPWCGICGSKDLRFETSATIFDSMAVAGEFLAREERKQMQTRAFFENLRRTARNN